MSAGGPSLVVFGAGNIGRSFVARVFSAGGYEVVFADVDQRLVDALNTRGSYTVVEKSDDAPERTVTVGPVRAIRADDPEASDRELGRARLAAVSVGSGAFNAVISAIGRGCAARTEPLDVILAENIHGAAGRARSVLEAAGHSSSDVERRIGLVETSIGKMVPIMPEEIRAHDPLLCWTEPYNTLIVDRDAFRGPIPEIPDLQPVAPIGPWVDRKLYIHNMGHAAAAYLGYLYRPQAHYIWQVLEVPEVRAKVHRAMHRSAEALARRYPDSFSRSSLAEHVEDLLARFRNTALGDTVYRVGRDLPRKLRRDDRIVGAIATAIEQGVDPAPIAEVFRAAPRFAKPGPDGSLFPADAQFAARYSQEVTDRMLEEVVGIGADERELRAVLRGDE